MMTEFEEYLAQKHIEEHPEILDDMVSDHYDNWLANLEIDQVISWADEYAEIRIQQLVDKFKEQYSVK